MLWGCDEAGDTGSRKCESCDFLGLVGVATGGRRGCYRQLGKWTVRTIEVGGQGLGEADMGVQGAMAWGLQNQT